MTRDPAHLRAQAARCREMSEKRRVLGGVHRGAHLYLVQLAQRLDDEAAEIERRMAGQKPQRPSAPK
jgi:hypothetical protein